MKPLEALSALHFARLLIAGADPIRERLGKNRAPLIDAMNAFVSIPRGSPYCAAGLSFCFELARLSGERGLAFPMSGSSQAIRRAFEARRRLFRDPQKLMDCEGAIGGWTNEDGAHGHVFGVSRRLTASGKVVAIETWEFNTDRSSKDRDGEGAYMLERSIEELRRTHPNFWFLDTTDIAGGSWWS